MSKKRALIGILAASVGVGAVYWVAAAPPKGVEIAPAYHFTEVSSDILAVESKDDVIADQIEAVAGELPGYDDVVVQEHLGRAFATGLDGWIWKIDLEAGSVERFVDAPLMAAGARAVPGDDDRIVFCSSVLYGESYPEGERVGLYQLTISTKEIVPLALDVPTPGPRRPAPAGNEGTLFVGPTLGDAGPVLRQGELGGQASRPIAFCNDVDLSADGQRAYFSEPFAYEGASMGGGAYAEAVSLGRNGLLWKVDLAAGEVSLVAQGYTFVDGVLLEQGADGREQSVLVTETPKFRILRFYLGGPRAGEDEVVWDSLPSMPDGLDRDTAGRIWVGLLKERTPLIKWIHANPWIKPLFLRLPAFVRPDPANTGVLVLSADGSEPLGFARHGGDPVRDIAVAIPFSRGVFLASAHRQSRGYFVLPYAALGLDAPPAK